MPHCGEIRHLHEITYTRPADGNSYVYLFDNGNVQMRSSYLTVYKCSNCNQTWEESDYHDTSF